MATIADSKTDITLNSPVGAKPAVYKWPLTYVSKGQKIDGAEEIVETINWVAREYNEFRPAIENLMRDPPDMRSYDCIKNLCDRYNKIFGTVLKMNEGTSVAPKTSSRAPQGLLKHIIQQVYNYAVTDPNELNKYSPFSSKTYGETNFDFMAQLIEKNQFRPKEDDVFIDMGSGVGHLVLQMAASVECKKCYGIEISDNPARYAKVMEDRFKFWMNWHGKTYTDFELFHGDFFEKKYVDIIKSAKYILVNNFAFKPEVDHKLKQRFLDLRDGVQILSSKPFCSPKSRVTERHLTDIGSIMKVLEIHPEQKKDTVSWTPKPLPYYLHILDASPVEKYYERKKRRQGRSVERGKPAKRRRAGRASDSEDDLDKKVVCGPTTRSAWIEYCTATNASHRASTDSVKTVSSRNNSTDTEHYESAIESEENNLSTKTKGSEGSHKREKKNDTQDSTAEKPTASQGTSAQTRSGSTATEKTEAKSCLDKKRDYAIKKTGVTNLLQSAPPSALYSISKPAEPTNGTTTSKIPNIVIKVKPPAETKVSGDDLKTTTATKEEQKSPEPKTNENSKKLRQRKKSNAENTEQPPKQKSPKIRVQREATKKAQSAKAAPKASPKTNKASTSASSILSTTTTSNTSRSKKVLGATSKPASTKAQAVSKRKANPSERGSSLDLLHAKTVESVAGSAGYFPLPAPGCEDYNLRNITDTPSLPKVIIKDLSMFISDFLGQKMIDKFTEITRRELDIFARKLQQPGAKEALSREIDKERLRQRMLIRERDELIRDIKFLNDRVPRAMKVHCDDLGIKNTPKSIVAHLGALLKKHQDLTTYQVQLEATLQSNQRTMNPPAAHSNSSQCLSSPYRNTSSSATLDLSLKTVA